MQHAPTRTQHIGHCSKAVTWWQVGTLLTALVLTACTATPPTQTAPATPSPPVVSSEPDHDQKFALWVAGFSASARAEGITAQTLNTAFATVRFLPQVIASDRAQPEFTRTAWEYLDSAVSAQRVTRGQEKLAQLRTQIDPITKRYGVPAEVLIAIWGMESSYGSFMGDIPTVDALATLGFEGRREAWARSQLMDALRILQSGDIDRAHMIGSWAGAMGQTQFLPSSFLAYAVDADGDGRRDIWGSLPDVMASTANFLAKSGWQTGQAWGTEVQLPPGFDYTRANADVRQSSAAWSAEQVQTMDGATLPTSADSAILLPAGARGPAFLVGANFRTILRYNASNNYALAVHLLAQQLANGPSIQAAWPRDLQAMSREELLALQTALNARGFDSGKPDGMMGPATQRGVRAYQSSQGLPADGYPTRELIRRLQ